MIKGDANVGREGECGQSGAAPGKLMSLMLKVIAMKMRLVKLLIPATTSIPDWGRPPGALPHGVIERIVRIVLANKMAAIGRNGCLMNSNGSN